MQIGTWLKGLAVGLAVVMGGSAALAAPATMPAMGDQAASPKLKGYYAIIAKELDLTADQQVKVAALVDQRDTAAAKWETDNKPKIDAAEKALADAKAAKDKEATTKAQAEIKTLSETRPKTQVDIKPILTPEQLKKYNAYGVYIGAMEHYSKAQLTEDQKAKIKELSAKYGDQIRVDDKAKAKEATDAFHAEADKLLTADQLAKMKAPAEKGATTKPAKGM